MWLIIRLKDNAVYSTAYTEPPEGAWNPDLFAIKEWPGNEPPIHSPDEGIESYDPTLDDPAWGAKAKRRIALPNAATQLELEADWLKATIPTIPAMTLPELAATVQRLARQNLTIMEALQYYLWRFQCDKPRPWLTREVMRL